MTKLKKVLNSKRVAMSTFNTQMPLSWAFSEGSLGRNTIGAIHTLIKLLKTKNYIT